MPTPTYIAAYDVTEARRRRQMVAVVRQYAATGQLSAYECELTPPQQRDLLEQVGSIINAKDDRFVLLKVTAVICPRRSAAAGQSSSNGDRDWHYLG